MIDLQAAKRKCLPMAGVLRFGGDSESDASTNQTDNRATFGDGAVQATSGAVVNMTSDKAFEVVDSVIGKSEAMTKDVTTQAFKTIDKTGALVSAAYADAKGRGAMTDTITLAALAVAGGVAFLALKSKGSK